jgi:formylmethanofuran dehydrogenase subunit E
MKSLEEYIQAAAKDGDTRSGIIQGIRMAMIALKELGIEEPKQAHRSLIAFVEVDRCLPDAVQLVTGCRLGNRTLKFKDFGKMAATFVDLRTRRALRLAAKESAYQQALERFSGLDKEEALGRAYRQLSDEELFVRQWVQVPLSAEELPGYRAPRVVCAECGEGINFNREVIRDQRTLCRACAGEPYCEPV